MTKENQSRYPIADGVMDQAVLTSMIVERAFFKAAKRGFEPGHELNDWLEAEKEISNQWHYWQQELD